MKKIQFFCAIIAYLSLQSCSTAKYTLDISDQSIVKDQKSEISDHLKVFDDPNFNRDDYILSINEIGIQIKFRETHGTIIQKDVCEYQIVSIKQYEIKDNTIPLIQYSITKVESDHTTDILTVGQAVKDSNKKFTTRHFNFTDPHSKEYKEISELVDIIFAKYKDIDGSRAVSKNLISDHDEYIKINILKNNTPPPEKVRKIY